MPSPHPAVVELARIFLEFQIEQMKNEKEGKLTAKDAVRKSRIAEAYILLIEAAERERAALQKLQEFLRAKGLDLAELPPKEALIETLSSTLTDTELSELHNLLNLPPKELILNDSPKAALADCIDALLQFAREQKAKRTDQK